MESKTLREKEKQKEKAQCTKCVHSEEGKDHVLHIEWLRAQERSANVVIYLKRN